MTIRLMPRYHGLKMNPFYEKHNHENVGESRQMLLEILTSEMEEAFNAKSPFIISLLGAVGVGKSFTLKQLSKYLGDPSHFKEPKKVMTVIFEATQSGPPTKYIEYLFHSMIKRIGKKGLETIRREFNEKYQEEEYEEVLSDIDINFKNAFLKFNDASKQNIIIDWLTGERINLRDLQKIGINIKIENATATLEAFSSFSKLLKKVDYVGVILFIDEAEELALSGTVKLVNVLTQIKKVFEESKNKLSDDEEGFVPLIFCLSFTPGTYQLITGAETAIKESGRTGSAGLSTFLRRIGREYYIDPLTKEELMELFNLLLNSVKEHSSTTYKPFDGDAVAYLADISQGIPGTLLDYARNILQFADDEKIDRITLDIATKCLIERGLIPEEGLSSSGEDVEEVDI